MCLDTLTDVLTIVWQTMSFSFGAGVSILLVYWLPCAVMSRNLSTFEIWWLTVYKPRAEPQRLFVSKVVVFGAEVGD